MDDGRVHVFASDGKSAGTALKMIRDVTATAEIGKTYLGTVVRLAEFGAFVEIFPAPTACCTSAKSRNSAYAPFATN